MKENYSPLCHDYYKITSQMDDAYICYGEQNNREKGFIVVTLEAYLIVKAFVDVESFDAVKDT